MKLDGNTVSGRFISRPNRFLTLVEVDGEVLPSHLPDPGRLQELLLPGAELLLRPVPPGTQRKTRYTTVMVRRGRQWISLVSSLPNRFVGEALSQGILPMFRGYSVVKAEIAHGRHRFDFLLRDPAGQDFYLEVKSVTYVEQGIAQFPDAVSLRAARHLEALQKLVARGIGAGVLFVCQRPDAREFQPMWERDPNFSRALVAANSAGVRVWCITLHVSPTEITLFREIPVNLHHS
jgi:sugar fermentation stimulation protein A